MTTAGLSNLISTLLVIMLYGDFSKNKYLVMQSLASTIVMILSMKLFKIYKSMLFDKDTKEQDTWIKNRVDNLLNHFEKSIGTNNLFLLSGGIVL